MNNRIEGFAVVRIDRYGAGLASLHACAEVARDHASDGECVAAAWVEYAANGNVRIWNFSAPQ